jgi:hypothetical protein
MIINWMIYVGLLVFVCGGRREPTSKVSCILYILHTKDDIAKEINDNFHIITVSEN